MVFHYGKALYQVYMHLYLHVVACGVDLSKNMAVRSRVNLSNCFRCIEIPPTSFRGSIKTPTHRIYAPWWWLYNYGSNSIRRLFDWRSLRSQCRNTTVPTGLLAIYSHAYLHRAKALSDVFCLTSVCLSRTSGLTREQRGLGRLKLAQR